MMCKVKEVPHILNDLSGKLKSFLIMILCDSSKGECKERTVANIYALHIREPVKNVLADFVR